VLHPLRARPARADGLRGVREPLAADHRANGGRLVGYFLPKEGPNNIALALIEFASLAAYEAYRQRMAADDEAQANFGHARDTRCILVETRSFLRRVTA